MTSNGYLRLAATVVIAVVAMWAHMAMATAPALCDRTQFVNNSGVPPLFIAQVWIAKPVRCDLIHLHRSEPAKIVQ
jgi:hypothetical protein